MYSAGGNAVLPALGFPIRESADQWLFSAYPRLIAAVHALHRLLVPRHPPCALPILTVITCTASGPERRPSAEHAVIPVCWQCCAVFKVREEAHAYSRRPVSQNSTACGARAELGAARSGRRFGSRSDRRHEAEDRPRQRGRDLRLTGAGCAGRLSDRSNPGASLERR